MAREHPDYRNILESLNLRFPDYDMLSLSEVMQVTNIKTKNTALKHYGKMFTNGRIHKAVLARCMCPNNR